MHSRKTGCRIHGAMTYHIPVAQEVRQLLKERHPKTIEGITDEVYQLPPFIPKVRKGLMERAPY